MLQRFKQYYEISYDEIVQNLAQLMDKLNIIESKLQSIFKVSIIIIDIIYND